MTYKETVNEMKTAFFEKLGENVKENSFEEKLLEAVASEIYALYCYADNIFKQSFVQTASGEYLDMLGEMRDCKRKSGTKATGVLTFYNSQNTQENIQIAKGTVCSVEGEPFLQFITLENATIYAGNTATAVSAEALDIGEAYNVKAGVIKVMVNAPAGVESVVNYADFTGGSAVESDSSYRERIIRNYTVPQNGVGKTSVENKICKLSYIDDCRVFSAQSEGVISLAVRMKDGHTLTDKRIEAIRACIGFADIVGATVEITKATPLLYSLLIDARLAEGADTQAAEQTINEIVFEVLSEEKIGKSISLSSIVKALADCEEILDVDINGSAVVGGEIVCPSTSYLKLYSTKVSCYYE